MRSPLIPPDVTPDQALNTLLSQIKGDPDRVHVVREGFRESVGAAFAAALDRRPGG